jgi:hypothetical protein
LRAVARAGKRASSNRTEDSSMLDTPFEFCTVCRDYVLLDTTQRQCAREHQCADAVKCPLQRYFTGIEFHNEPGNPDHRHPKG